MLKGYGRIGDLGAAELMFEVMAADRDQRPDVVALNSILDACVRNGDLRRAVEILEQVIHMHMIGDGHQVYTILGMYLHDVELRFSVEGWVELTLLLAVVVGGVLSCVEFVVPFDFCFSLNLFTTVSLACQVVFLLLPLMVLGSLVFVVILVPLSPSLPPPLSLSRNSHSGERLSPEQATDLRPSPGLGVLVFHEEALGGRGGRRGGCDLRRRRSG